MRLTPKQRADIVERVVASVKASGREDLASIRGTAGAPGVAFFSFDLDERLDWCRLDARGNVTDIGSRPVVGSRSIRRMYDSVPIAYEETRQSRRLLRVACDNPPNARRASLDKFVADLTAACLEHLRPVDESTVERRPDEVFRRGRGGA